LKCELKVREIPGLFFYIQKFILNRKGAKDARNQGKELLAHFASLRFNIYEKKWCEQPEKMI